MDYQEFYSEMNEHYYRANAFHTMKAPDQDATSGNHSVINATYHLISKKLGGYEDPVQLSRDFVKQLRFVQSIEKEPGIYLRHVTKPFQPQTHDDYIGLVVTSKLLYPIITAEYIADYGANHNWYFDVQPVPFTWNITLNDLKAKFDSWHGKFPGLAGVYKRAAGQPINWLDRLGFCASITVVTLFPGSPSSTSGKILQWLQNSIMKGESKMVDKCIERWENMIKREYPTGYFGEVLGVYHRAEHPFSRAMWGKI